MVIFIVIAAVGFVFATLTGLPPASLSPVALLLAIIALIAAVLAFATRYYYYLYAPVLRSKSGSVVLDPDDAFYMSQNGNAILVRKDNLIYATSFIKVPVYSSSTEMNDEQKFNFSNVFSRMVSISKTPIKVTSQLYSINKDDYIARVTSRLNEAEARYNAIQLDKNASKPQLDRIKGEVTMWHNLLDSVSKANSQALDVYAAVTVFGGTEEEAMNMISLKADEVAAGISATVGVSASVVTGADMLVLVEPEYMIPPTTISELMRYSQNQQTQNMM